MEFYSQLYIGEKVKNSRRIVRRLSKGQKVKNAYVITLAYGNDLLEIYHAATLSQKFYENFDRPVVGIADSYDEAVALVSQIVEDTLKVREDCNVKAYLASKMTLEGHG